MRSILFILALPAVLAQPPPASETANIAHITEMCFPNLAGLSYNNSTQYLGIASESPFPCEQVAYLTFACITNGSLQFDFITQQQCLCGGSYFDSLRGCYNCYEARGVPSASITYLESQLASISTAECSATPVTKAFDDVLPAKNSIDIYATLNPDKFPSDTKVQNYWTGPTRAVPGVVGTAGATGSVTSEVNVPTDAGTQSGTGTETGVGTQITGAPTGSGASGSSTASPSSSTSSAGATEKKAAGGC